MNRRTAILWGVGFAIGITALVLVFLFFTQPRKEEEPPPGSMHWHANFSISVCGEKRFLNFTKGIELLHTHADGVIHIEGVVENPRELTLKRFFDVVGVPFNRSCVWSYCDGGFCDDKTAELKLFVNGNLLPKEEMEKYSVRHMDQINVTYG